MDNLEARVAKIIGSYKAKGCDCKPGQCNGGRADSCAFVAARKIIDLELSMYHDRIRISDQEINDLLG